MWHLLVPGSLPASKVANFLASARHPPFRITHAVRGQGSASWRARVERRLIRFRVRMAERLGTRLLGQRSLISCCLRWPQMQSAEQIRCTAGEELQPDLAVLDELGNVLPKKRVCRGQASKPQPGLSRNINF